MGSQGCLKIATAEVERYVVTYRYFPSVFVLPPWQEIYRTDVETRSDRPSGVPRYLGRARRARRAVLVRARQRRRAQQPAQGDPPGECVSAPPIGRVQLRSSLPLAEGVEQDAGAAFCGLGAVVFTEFERESQRHCD
jgi:hypothetical protein